MAARFRPRELRQDATPDELRRQLNDYFRDIAADLGAITARPRITEVQLGDYTARFGEIVRMAPPTAGARLILPAPNAAQPNGRVTLLLVGKSGAVTVEVVSSTINGAATLALGAGEGLVEFTLASDTDGWLAASTDILLAPAASTSIVYDLASHEYQRATLTGDVTASQNSNATTIATGAVTTAKIADANVTNAKLANMASDTVKGNVSGSTGAPSDVSLSSLAGTDLTFSAHALSVSSTWSSVLGRGATSGAHNPIIDSGQWLGFGASPGSVSTGTVRSDGDLLIRSNGGVTVFGDVGAGIGTAGDITLVTTTGDVKLDAVAGRVAVFGKGIDFTGVSSTSAVSSGHGMHWVKTDSPSRPYFRDDGNTDNKLAYVSDITGIANSQLANMASDTVKGNVSGSTGAPSDVSLSSLAGSGLSFSGHQFSVTTGAAGGGMGAFRKFSASTFSPVALYNFQNSLADSSGNGLNLTGASSFFRAIGMQTDGTPIYAVAESVNADLARGSHDSALAITGDITVQIIVLYTSLGTSSSTAEWVAFEGGDETAANNYLWAVIQGTGAPDTGSPKWFSEHGSGVDDTYSPSGTGNAVRVTGCCGLPVYWAFTRASNVIQGYFDGKPWGAASSALTTPTGGSTSTLRFFNKGSFGEFILCCKISASALSAANIASEYNSTLGLVKGLV